jgi:hypothetical protein
MVITDLYHPAEEPLPARAARGQLPGIEHAGRCGARTALQEGWRTWLARSLGREDLVSVAPARIAAAVLAGNAAAGAPSDSCWIATPVHLTAGLAHVHLDHRGLLRLPEPQLAALAAAFARTFAGSGLSLAPLPSGEFLLRAPGIEAVATREPERCAGAEIAAALPRGVQAAGLRRTAAEIEMWLHTQRAAAGGSTAAELTVNALWLWGGAGAVAVPQIRAATAGRLAFGADAYLHGLWHLEGGVCRAPPASLAAALPEAAEAAYTVLALRVAEGLRESMQSTFTEALRSLDERFIAPALGRLGPGGFGSVTVVGNDVALTVRRGSRWRRWRRGRVGLGSFA